MYQALLTAQQYLVGEGIAYQQVDETEIKFRYQWDEHAFVTHVGVEDNQVIFAFTWERQIRSESIDYVVDVMKQIVNAGTRTARTHVNLRTGVVCSTASVELCARAMTPCEFGDMLRSMLEPFQTVTFLLAQVLNQDMPLDVAVASFGDWDHRRIHAIMRELMGQPPIDPLLN